MNTNAIIAIGVVAVLVVAGGAAAILMTKDDGSKSDEKTMDCKLRVMGNAEQDNYLDKKDVEFIQDIIDGKKVWDRNKDRLADANNDGVIDTADVELVNKFLAGTSATMYYLDWDNGVRSVQYPLTEVLGTSYLISTEFTTGIDIAIILGIDSKVKYVANTDMATSKLDTTIYPNVGDAKSFFFKTPDLETMYADGVRILMGDHPAGFANYSETAAAEKFTCIKLPLNRSVNGTTSLDTLITLGVMFNLQDKTAPFIKFMDKVNDKIESAVSSAGVKSKSYVIPYMAPGYETFYIDAHSSGKYTMADVIMLERLPVISKVTTKAADGFDEMSVEAVAALNPDIFVVSMFAYAEDKDLTANDYKNDFKSVVAKGLDKTEAGKNNMLFAIPFETCTLAGYASLLVLASMIWPDAFDANEGWDLMQEYYDTFTNFKGDVKTSKFAPLAYADLKA